MGDQVEEKRGRAEWWALTVDCPDARVMTEFNVALVGGHITRQPADDANLDAGDMLLTFRAAPDDRRSSRRPRRTAGVGFAYSFALGRMTGFERAPEGWRRD